MTDAPPTKSKAPPRDRFLGTLVGGKYRIDAKLAKGGMGSIYKATQEPLGRDVVVKILSQDHGKIGGRKVDEKRFFREASIASRLSHPNTVVIHDYGSLDEDGGFYLVMEYLGGRDLAAILAEDGPLSAERTLHMLRQVASSLHEAHEAGVIHRDLKPGNLIVVDRGGDPDFVKVVDFGLVKPVDEEIDEAATEQGVVIGSPLYMSPEQIFAGELDQRTDIYSLGCVAFEMLTGRPPFIRDKESKKRGIGEIIRGHASQPPPALRSVRPSVNASQALERIVRRCLAKKMEHRWDSMRDMLAALNDAPEFATSGPAPITAERRTDETMEFQRHADQANGTAQFGAGSLSTEGAQAPLDITGALAPGADLTGAVTGSSTSEHLATTGPRMVARVTAEAPAAKLTPAVPEPEPEPEPERAPEPEPEVAAAPAEAEAPEPPVERPDATSPMSSEVALELARGPAEEAPAKRRSGLLWVGLVAIVVIAAGVTVAVTGSDGSTPTDRVSRRAPSAVAPAKTETPETPAKAEAPKAGVTAKDPALEAESVEDELVILRIESEPAGAEVFHGAGRLGRTPVSTTVRRGDLPRTWTLKLEGYRPHDVVQKRTSMSNIRLRPVLVSVGARPAADASGGGADAGVTRPATAPALEVAPEGAKRSPKKGKKKGAKKPKRDGKKGSDGGMTIKMTR